MSNVVDMCKNEPHVVSEVICVACGYRWISVRPQNVWLKELECGCCHKTGQVIQTGQELQEGGKE
jgi:hypothetical protein